MWKSFFLLEVPSSLENIQNLYHILIEFIWYKRLWYAYFSNGHDNDNKDKWQI